MQIGVDSDQIINQLLAGATSSTLLELLVKGTNTPLAIVRLYTNQQWCAVYLL